MYCCIKYKFYIKLKYLPTEKVKHDKKQINCKDYLIS